MPSEDLLDSPSIRLGQCRFDRARLELRGADNRVIPLRPQAIKVLEHLLVHAGRVVGRDELFEAVWPGVVVTDDSLVQCVSDIRAALGDAGRDLLRTVPRRGYRLDVAAPPTTAGPRLQEPRAMLPPHGGFVLTVALLAFALLGLVVWQLKPPAEVARPPAHASTIAVLPFGGDTSADTSAALAAGMAEDLVGDLARNIDMRLISARSSFAAGAASGEVPAIARRLGARYLVDGRVRAEPDTLQLRVQLIDGLDGHVVWTDDSQITASNLAVRREALLRRIAGSLRTSMIWDQKRLALGSVPSSLDTYTLTLRALANKHRMSAEATRAARSELAEALRRQPDYAPAWAVLGYVNALDAGLQITGEWSPAQLGVALQQIEHSIALDALQPLAWQALAVTLSWTPRKADALAAAEQALKLAPGDADNLTFHALSLMAVERYDEAAAQIRLAQALYPIAPAYVDAMASMVLWANGRFGEALQLTRTCAEKAPDLLTCRTMRVLALADLGQTAEARAELAIIGPLPFQDISAFVGRADAQRVRILHALRGAPPPKS